jgi:hypothetical protein
MVAARSVDEINISNFVNTGQTTPLPRYTFTLEIKWTNEEGVAQTHGPVTKTYPNDLAAMPLSVRRAFAEKMIQATVRVALGIDEWSSYE